MKIKNNRLAFYLTIILLIVLGVYLISTGDSGMGTGLIAGAIGVFSVKSIQHNRMAKLESEGKVAFDERSLYLSAKAALAAIRIYILVLAVALLAGSVFDPVWPLTPWDLIGFMLALLVFLWIGFYYYLNQVE
ncbi:hypothetical protein ASZ90_019065 [hydrocarbon metagenome]|uniref:Uncharacterized protein n=1 Tax=hydrocarbon metagenome TaxID=938273 RepID=A0A0W8E4C7_9ZZZZ